MNKKGGMLDHRDTEENEGGQREGGRERMRLERSDDGR